jgi:hypothetical protein
MAGDLSDYAEAQTGRWLFTDEAVTRPAQWWVALFTTAPSDAGGGVDYAGAGYARAQVNFGAGLTNDLAAAFTASGGDFPAGAAFAIFDAATSGNLLAWKLKAIPAVTDGASLRFDVGALSVAFD